MQINEIFKSIQGEGQQQGEPTIFIRTIGCNFRCKWCDTQYAYEGENEMTIDQILEKVESLECKNICLTGGEPLIQPDAKELIGKLVDSDFNVFVETNGSQSIYNFPDEAKYVLDFKLPSSGMYGQFDYKNLEYEPYEIKFVIQDELDYNIAKEFVNMYIQKWGGKDSAKLLFSPCWGKMSKRELAERMIKDKLPVRYSLQIHKIIWNKNTRGV